VNFNYIETKKRHIREVPPKKKVEHQTYKKLQHKNTVPIVLQESSGVEFDNSTAFVAKNHADAFIKAALKAEPSSGYSDFFSRPVLLGVKVLKPRISLR